MTESIHPAASHHLPSFITAPGQTDVLMIVMGIILVLFVLMIGVIAGLFLALIDFPDFSDLLKRIAGSTEKIAAKKPGEGAEQTAPGTVTVARQREVLLKAEGAARKPRPV
jgi:hypothetical protein